MTAGARGSPQHRPEGGDTAANQCHSKRSTDPLQLTLDDALVAEAWNAVAEAEAIIRGEPLTEADILFSEFAQEYLAEHGPTSEDELHAMYGLWHRGYVQHILDDGHQRGEYAFRRQANGVRIWSLRR